MKFPHFTPTPLCRVLLHHRNSAGAPGPPLQVWDPEEGFASTTMLSPCSWWLWLSAGMCSSQALHTLSNFYSSKLDNLWYFCPMLSVSCKHPFSILCSEFPTPAFTTHPWWSSWDLGFASAWCEGFAAGERGREEGEGEERRQSICSLQDQQLTDPVRCGTSLAAVSSCETLILSASVWLAVSGWPCHPLASPTPPVPQILFV